MFNRHQYPFVVLNISVNSECVDINVTPDKRQILLQEEKLLLAILKTSLLAMYSGSVNKLNLNNSLVDATGCFRKLSTESSNGGTKEQNVSDKGALVVSKLREAYSLNQKSSFGSPQKNPNKGQKSSPSQRTLQSFNFSTTVQICAFKSSSHICDNNEESGTPNSSGEGTLVKNDYDSEKGTISSSDSEVGLHTLDISNHRATESPKSSLETPMKMEEMEQFATDGHHPYHETEETFNHPTRKKEINNDSSPDCKRMKSEAKYTLNTKKLQTDSIDVPVNVIKKMVPLSFSMCRLARRMNKLKQRQQKEDSEMFRRFRAKIRPGENQAAEEELRKEISKDMFANMEIIGQFNLGFIITKLESDLFIIDQHATDEKYNFEMLQQNTVLQGQRLIIPQKLHLTAVNESILTDNVEIFKKNGFDFTFDEDAPVMERVKLVSLPTSKNWTFGQQDIEELIFMLSDSPGVMCRPSRVRQMFASRACRKSVMIGTALNLHEMKKLVTHMGEIEQPWNCPHGRPTIRHIASLDIISQD
ncbi:unnamed protein product [Staurois parvus]|uniref:MutL C-terminal dimerisation domain-containing protein n=1 Tax=Staurois parvus TaxID=386267 RepID=A0ABN9AL27_9NEOB|nr:unnamed protein product [Staurois parvus]